MKKLEVVETGAVNGAGVTAITLVELERLRPSPTNPRKDFDGEGLKELAGSIEKQGMVQPMIVCPSDGGFMIVAGERRWRAAKLAGLKAAPCLVRELSEEQIVEIQWVENLQRQDLKVMEEALGLKALMERGWTVEKLCERFGKERSTIFNRLKLARLKGAGLKQLESGKISPSIAMLVAILPGEELQKKFLKEITDFDGNIASFRRAKEVMEREFIAQLGDAPWDLAEAGLWKKCGSCAECPKRSGNMADFEDAKQRPNVCTDVECFGGKRKAWSARKVEELKGAGATVIPAEDWKQWRTQDRYEQLAEKCWVDPKRRTWKALLAEAGEKGQGKKDAKDAKELVLVPIAWAETEAGLIEVVEKGKARELLQKAGVLKKETGDRSGGQSYATMERKRVERERRRSDAEWGAITAAVEGMKPGIEFWRLLALGAIMAGGFYRSEAVARRRDLREKGKRPEDLLKKTVAECGNEGVLRGLAVELVAGYQNAALAKLLKVDLKKAVANAEAAAKRKGKGKKDAKDLKDGKGVKGKKKTTGKRK